MRPTPSTGQREGLVLPNGLSRALDASSSPIQWIGRWHASIVSDRRGTSRLFKRLATLRSDAPLFGDVEQLRWRGPSDGFAAWTQRISAPRLLERGLAAQAALQVG
jgi:hypothetical protein